MKYILALTALTSFALSGYAMAESRTAIGNVPGTFAADLNLTSDYVHRGISRSDEHIAIQGGANWAYEPIGIYLGTWASTVDMTDADAEVDFYGGFKGYKENLSWDLGMAYVYFPGADDDLDYDYWEFNASSGFEFDDFTAKAGLSFSPDYIGEADMALYPYLAADVPLPHDFSLHGKVGYQMVDNSDNYADWSLGAGYTYQIFNFGLTYHDTTLEDDECDNVCDGRVVLNVGTSF